jgi:YYY domain-containing protein
MMEFGLVALWLVVYIALLLAGLPLAATLFPRLADRGAGVAIPLSAAILWVVAYWVGHLSLSLAVWIGLLVLFAAVVAAVYFGDPDIDTRIVGETAAVFAVAFLFLIAIRAVDPAVHPGGGEKFLDFGLLRSLLRAETLPPEDMWFAGEPVKYYYGGHLLASLLTRLTGTAPRFAYNLALAGFYAMLVTAAYGVAGSLAASRGSPRVLGGLFGAFFVGIASNLRTAGAAAVNFLPDSVGGFVSGLFAVQAQGLASGDGFSYWHASRIIDGTINEFPFFAWLNGDLHAHMMSTPFLLLAAAALFSYARTPVANVRRRLLLVLGVVPPIAGLLAVVNTWSFPSIGGLTLLAVLLAPADPTTLLPDQLGRFLRNTGSRGKDELGRLTVAVAMAAGVVLLGLVWSIPFWLGTATGASRSLGLFPERSPLGPLLIVHGTFLLVFVPYLLRHGLPRVADTVKAWVMLLVVAVVAWLVKAPAVLLFGPLIFVGWALLRFTGGASDVGHRPAPSVAAADGGEQDTKDGESVDEGEEATAERDASTDGDRLRDRPGFEVVLLIAGAGLALLVELLFVKEEAGPGRLNTVFKTYMQVWVLWAVAAGAIVTHLVSQHRPSLSLSGGRWKPAFSVFAALLVVSTSLYAGFALQSHFAGWQSEKETSRVDDPTLDGTAFVETSHPGEAPAIEWLDTNVAGQPNIVSAPGGYSWNARDGDGASAPSSLTGVPTVVGWFHEIGYRGQEAYRTRVSDVRTIYTGSPAERVRLLRQYDVEYVYVGPAEQETYGQPTFAGVEGVTVEKRWDAVTIYRVDQDALETTDGQAS